MEEILHHLVGNFIPSFFNVFLHPRWLLGISEPSTTIIHALLQEKIDYISIACHAGMIASFVTFENSPPIIFTRFFFRHNRRGFVAFPAPVPRHAVSMAATK